MSTEEKQMAFVGIVFVGIMLLVFAMGYHEDQYCKTTPLDRIDRERCGLEKK